MVRWGKFQVVGHLTLPLRYLNERRGFHLTFDGFEDRLEAILRLVVEQGLGIEVNTNHGNTPLPDEKWLRMYRALGGEIITVGTDAHKPQDVGSYLDLASEILQLCGFKYYTIYEKRSPEYHKL